MKYNTTCLNHKMITMKKILFFTISLLYAHCILAQKKITYGVGLDVFQSKLVNIDKENYSGHFLSVPYYKEKEPIYGLSPTIQVQYDINEKWHLMTGLGYIRHHSQFHFDYTDNWNLKIETTLINKLHYLTIPILLNYNIWDNSKHSIDIGAGILNKVFIKAQSNFPDIIFEDMYVPLQGKSYVLSSRIEMKYNFAFNSNSKASLLLFLSQDVTSYVSGVRIFQNTFIHDNLGKSKYLFYGIGFRYFFTNLKQHR